MMLKNHYYGCAGSPGGKYQHGLSGHLPGSGAVQEDNRLSGPYSDGRKEAGNILAVDRDIADEYFYEEDQMVTMAEMGM